MKYSNISQNMQPAQITLLDMFSHGKSKNSSLLNSFGAIFKNVYTIRSCAQLWGGPEFSKDRKCEDRVQLKRTLWRNRVYDKNIQKSRISWFWTWTGTRWNGMGWYFARMEPMGSGSFLDASRCPETHKKIKKYAKNVQNQFYMIFRVFSWYSRYTAPCGCYVMTW